MIGVLALENPPRQPYHLSLVAAVCLQITGKPCRVLMRERAMIHKNPAVDHNHRTIRLFHVSILLDSLAAVNCLGVTSPRRDRRARHCQPRYRPAATGPARRA